jgi:type III secretory pathway component EscT
VAPLVDEIARAAGGAGVDLEKVGLAWARVAPAVAIVPAFGLRALPAGARAVFGLTLALAVFPAIGALGPVDASLPWPALVVLEAVRGLPVAIAAAVPLWAATMAGGIVDGLRGANDPGGAPVVEGRPTSLGVPMSLLASFLFLVSGGPSRLAAALARGDFPANPLHAAARDLAGGITLAVALAGPLLAAAMVLEVALALTARAASPAQVNALAGPARTMGILAIFAVVMDRIAGVLALSMR